MRSRDDDSVQEVVDSEGHRLALVVRQSFVPLGVQFLSNARDNQQIAYMARPKGEYITAHSHLPFVREVTGTSEVLVMRKGTMRLDLFSPSRKYVGSLHLHAGDVVVLMLGGHGFELLEDVDFIEVKQGPYVDGKDKEKFVPDTFDVAYLDT